MRDLDDTSAITRLDSIDVLGAIERLAAQCREAWTLGAAAGDLPNADGVENIVVLGMGGSGISGDVVQAVVEPRLGVPLQTIKGYGPLPEWIGRNSLVFAVSYSGDTEETLEAFEEAHHRGARAVVVSSGGRLGELAASYAVAHVRIPGGLQPRAALGFLALPILAVLVEIGLVPDCSDDVEETIATLADIAKRCGREVGTEENAAKRLARSVNGRVPVIYGGTGLGGVAAYRFKCDLNEYGKSVAFYNVIPELDHNELESWDALAELTRERFVAVLLRDSGEHPRVALRFDLTRKLMEERLATIVEVHSEGTSALARLLSLVMITQLAAIYVGLGYERDPGPVTVLQDLKQRLKDN
jgi:glucose/mannose-6-phosphate isomerase